MFRAAAESPLHGRPIRLHRRWRWRRSTVLPERRRSAPRSPCSQQYEPDPSKEPLHPAPSRRPLHPPGPSGRCLKRPLGWAVVALRSAGRMSHSQLEKPPAPAGRRPRWPPASNLPDSTPAGSSSGRQPQPELSVDLRSTPRLQCERPLTARELRPTLPGSSSSRPHGPRLRPSGPQPANAKCPSK